MTNWVTGRERLRLQLSLFVIFFVFAAEYAAIARVFLPKQIEGFDPAGKVSILATVAICTSIAIAIVTPLSGALSDRLRVRWGRRTPFILGGAAIGQILILCMAFAPGLLSLAVAWVAGAFFLNAMKAPMTTLIADRFDAGGRGTASGFMGAGLTSGLTAGTIVAAFTAEHLVLGYTLFAGTLMLVAVGFVAFNREPSSVDMPLERFDWRRFVSGFWVDPRAHPDFAWAFLSRFFLFMGYTAVVGYTLYTLRDMVKLPPAEASRALALIFTIELFTGIVTGLACGWLSDRLRRRKPFVIFSSIMMAASFAIPAVMPTLTGMYAYAVVLGLGYGAYYSVDMALMTDVLPVRPHDSAGRDLGILSLAITLPQIVGLGLAALVLGATGNDYRYLFGFGALLVLLSSAMVLPIRSVR